MKKVITLITMLAVVCALVIPTFAFSTNSVGPTASGTTHTVKKTDSANVVKDGIIDANEYERLDVDLSEDQSPLHLVYNPATEVVLAQKMLPTMEYYASWSDGQINIAVKASPEDLKQIIHMSETVNPDDFCKNVAFTVSSDHEQERPKGAVCNFYFAMSLTTDTNEYQVAWYDTEQNQRGNSGTYAPKPGQDFVISYTADSVIFEMSVPFSEITASGTADAGDSVYLTIATTSGTSQTGDGESVYGIVMGDFGYMVAQKGAVNHASFKLLADTIGGSGDEIGTTPSGEPAPDPTGTTQSGEPAPDPTDGGSSGSGSSEGGNGGGSSGGGAAPQTGDPMIVIAAISALGACGAVVVKKKFF